LNSPDSAFLVGIDLGTTNCAVAFVDTRTRRPEVELFPIAQLVEPSVVAPRPLLPSFLYFAEPHEIEGGEVALPWSSKPSAIAGVLARERGALAPARQVASAKSWLAHPGVDRRAAILPWGATSSPQISPIDASARYLTHIREAWNATVAGGEDQLRLEHQRIVLTVPASFDEEARELTVEAAREAQFANLTLLEEPVAAFYAWITEQYRVRSPRARGAKRSREELLENDRVALVCDVGGGTTDFSLIRIVMDSGAPAFERIAVGDHLLLGGDNVDLALAARVERQIAVSHPGARLAITQRAALRRICSAAKEQLLGDAAPDRVAVTVLGAGRAVVGAAMTSELTRADVDSALDEFLPVTAPGEIAAARDRRAGLRELGLPYETDPAITRHLAAFLARAAAGTANAAAGGDVDGPAIVDVAGRAMVRPDLVLFNGGFFTPEAARDRVVQALAAWFGDAPRVLTTSNLESAVATGAATYARLRASVGRPLPMVKAGSGRAYYVGLRAAGRDEATPAVCVVARGTEEGTEIRLEHPFTVATNQAISFALYSSTIRSDRAADIVSLQPGDDAHEHAPLVTVLRYGRKSRQVELPVRLSVSLTEVGIIELWCASQVSEHKWRLHFQVRGDSDDESDDEQESGDAEVPDELIATAEAAIRSVFGSPGAAGPAGDGQLTAENLVAYIEQTIGFGKTAWPLTVMRRFADMLIAVAAGRRGSASLEARWLNLFGFCFRPGFGAAKDPWRIGEARKIYAAGLAFPAATQNRVEWLVLWQRVAGGFSTGQQRELAQRLTGELGLGGKKAARLNPQIERESWRLLASLERLEPAARVKAGDELIRRVRRDAGNASLLWAMGRLGARTPLYGPLSSVVPPNDATRWLDALLAIKLVTADLAAAVVQVASRVGDPLRDLDDEALARARARLGEAGIGGDALRPLEEVIPASTFDASRVFGEPLPHGLRLEDASGSAPLVVPARDPLVS
jgi:actin-like ATPase involved in cell morphogenesis